MLTKDGLAASGAVVQRSAAVPADADDDDVEVPSRTADCGVYHEGGGGAALLARAVDAVALVIAAHLCSDAVFISCPPAKQPMRFKADRQRYAITALTFQQLSTIVPLAGANLQPIQAS